MQKQKLLKVLTKHEKLFNGKLGMLEGEFNIQMKENAPESLQQRCFLVPRVQEKRFKAELERLYKLGVLCKLNNIESKGNYAFPAFLV